jgi:hypothetical protein
MDLMEVGCDYVVWIVQIKDSIVLFCCLTHFVMPGTKAVAVIDGRA